MTYPTQYDTGPGDIESAAIARAERAERIAHLPRPEPHRLVTDWLAWTEFMPVAWTPVDALAVLNEVAALLRRSRNDAAANVLARAGMQMEALVERGMEEACDA